LCLESVEGLEEEAAAEAVRSEDAFSVVELEDGPGVAGTRFRVGGLAIEAALVLTCS